MSLILTGLVNAESVTAPKADFSASVTSGSNPLTVQFTDKSTGSPISWAWIFGDGSISRDKNPSHMYENAGKYSVLLKVSNLAGSNEIYRLNYIAVSESDTPTTAPIGQPTTVPTTDVTTLVQQEMPVDTDIPMNIPNQIRILKSPTPKPQQIFRFNPQTLTYQLSSLTTLVLTPNTTQAYNDVIKSPQPIQTLVSTTTISQPIRTPYPIQTYNDVIKNPHPMITSQTPKIQQVNTLKQQNLTYTPVYSNISVRTPGNISTISQLVRAPYPNKTYNDVIKNPYPIQTSRTLTTTYPIITPPTPKLQQIYILNQQNRTYTPVYSNLPIRTPGNISTISQPIRTPYPIQTYNDVIKNPYPIQTYRTLTTPYPIITSPIPKIQQIYTLNQQNRTYTPVYSNIPVRTPISITTISQPIRTPYPIQTYNDVIKNPFPIETYKVLTQPPAQIRIITPPTPPVQQKYNFNQSTQIYNQVLIITPIRTPFPIQSFNPVSIITPIRTPYPIQSFNPVSIITSIRTPYPSQSFNPVSVITRPTLDQQKFLDAISKMPKPTAQIQPGWTPVPFITNPTIYTQQIKSVPYTTPQPSSQIQQMPRYIVTTAKPTPIITRPPEIPYYLRTPLPTPYLPPHLP